MDSVTITWRDSFILAPNQSERLCLLVEADGWSHNTKTAADLCNHILLFHLLTTRYASLTFWTQRKQRHLTIVERLTQPRIFIRSNSAGRPCTGWLARPPRQWNDSRTRHRLYNETVRLWPSCWTQQTVRFSQKYYGRRWMRNPHQNMKRRPVRGFQSGRQWREEGLSTTVLHTQVGRSRVLRILDEDYMASVNNHSLLAP